MVVKVSDKYKGVYGHFNKELNAVEAKRAGDPPFNIAPGIAERHIKSGVLVALDPAEIPKTAAEPKVKVTAQAPVSTQKAFKDMGFPELKAAAKERGINIVGKKKGVIIKMLEEYEETAPSFSAEDPI